MIEQRTSFRGLKWAYGLYQGKNKQRTYIFSGKTTAGLFQSIPSDSTPWPWGLNLMPIHCFLALSLHSSIFFFNVIGGKNFPLLNLPKTRVSSDMLLFCLTILIFKDYQEGTETVCTCPMDTDIMIHPETLLCQWTQGLLCANHLNALYGLMGTHAGPWILIHLTYSLESKMMVVVKVTLYPILMKSLAMSLDRKIHTHT